MIVYFSGTGNSRWAAQFLAAELGEETADAGAYLRGGRQLALSSERPWIFVTPTYAWGLPRVFAALLRGSGLSGNREAYFVMTCGDGIGEAAGPIEALCGKLGLRFRGVQKLVMPENYVVMFPVPDREKALAIVQAAEEPLRAAADRIRQGSPFPAEPVKLSGRVQTRLVNPLFYRFSVTAKPFFATDACISCRKCEQVCPLRNVALADGKPRWGGRCTHCMACICSCPVGAIGYGKKSRPQYLCPAEK